MKTCTKCGLEKPLEAFCKNRSGRRPDCRICKELQDKIYRLQHKPNASKYHRDYAEKNKEHLTTYMRKYYINNREAVLEKAKKYRQENQDKLGVYWRKRRYGMSPETYNEMVLSQNMRCAICLSVTDKFHVDHNHETDKVRGLLCGKCNCGIGQLQDSPELLRQAALYIEQRSN